MNHGERILNAINKRLEIESSGLNVAGAFENAYALLTNKNREIFDKIMDDAIAESKKHSSP